MTRGSVAESREPVLVEEGVRQAFSADQRMLEVRAFGMQLRHHGFEGVVCVGNRQNWAMRVVLPHRARIDDRMLS